MYMPKTLIAISSCEYFENNGLNQPLRDTWLPEAVSLGFDYKFFHGEGATPKGDVVVLPVVDELYGLTEKARAKLRWALDNGFDYVFSCFPDTYTCPERLKDSGYQNHDYFGNVHKFPEGAPFCQGGPGYMLSRKACELIVKEQSSYLNDDCWVGDTLSKGGVSATHHSGFTAFGPGPLSSNENITNHLSTQPCGYTGENVRAEHRAWMESWKS